MWAVVDYKSQKIWKWIKFNRIEKILFFFSQVSTATGVLALTSTSNPWRHHNPPSAVSPQTGCVWIRRDGKGRKDSTSRVNGFILRITSPILVAAHHCNVIQWQRAKPLSLQAPISSYFFVLSAECFPYKSLFVLVKFTSQWDLGTVWPHKGPQISVILNMPWTN